MSVDSPGTRARRVLVIGEALVDVVARPDGSTDTHPGGSPANVALGLARLGTDVVLLTHLGDDAFGDLVRRHLTDAGVALEAQACGAATSVARADLDGAGAATYSFDLTWSLPVQLAQRPAAGEAPVHVHTGSLATVLDPGAAQVEALLTTARDLSTTSYDPNVRPALQGERTAAVARVERLVALSDVVKASDEDVQWLYPGHRPEAVAADWARRGPALVVVTLGREGAVSVTSAGHTIRTSPVAVTVADTVGAGDTFMAALLDGLARADLLGPARRAALHAASDEALTAILRRAGRAAALTVSRPGADLPYADELQAAHHAADSAATRT